MQLIARAIFCVILAVAPLCAKAWGAAGHRLIAELAQEQLSTVTRQRVQQLLDLEPGATLASISTWADEVRSPSTASWHFANFPRGACSTAVENPCPDGRCIAQALDAQFQKLANAESLAERLKALKWVVHFVADAHQPLHAGSAHDRGGNRFQVRAFGRGTNLHAVWDSGLIANWPGGLPALRDAATSAKQGVSSTLSVRAWLQESCELVGAPGFYPPDHRITAEYQDRWSPVVAARLMAAAQRLAASLERALR